MLTLFYCKVIQQKFDMGDFNDLRTLGRYGPYIISCGIGCIICYFYRPIRLWICRRMRYSILKSVRSSVFQVIQVRFERIHSDVIYLPLESFTRYSANQFCLTN